MTYVDTTGRRDTLTKYGFLIENHDMLARFGQDSLLEMVGLHELHPEATTMTRVAVFQFMTLAPCRHLTAGLASRV